MSKNPVIIFEGVEASGKSTNIKNVSAYLKKKNKKFIKIREPGGSKFSEKIRKLILNKKSKLNKKSDLLLLLAARSENIDKIIKKNYRKKIILIDRFTDSTLAYQHFGMGINYNLIKKINDFLLEKIKVDMIFLSLVNKTNMKKRLKFRKIKNKYDKFEFSFYRKVQNGFIKLAKNKKKYFILDSNKLSIIESKKFLINKINNFISK